MVVQRYSPPATPCGRLFNYETVSVEPKEQLCEHRARWDPTELLRTNRLRPAGRGLNVIDEDDVYDTYRRDVTPGRRRGRGIASDREAERDEVAGLEYGRGSGWQPESQELTMMLVTGCVRWMLIWRHLQKFEGQSG